MLPVWAIRRSLTIRSIRVVAAETDVLFLPVIGATADRLAAGLLIFPWWGWMSEQRHLPITTPRHGELADHYAIQDLDIWWILVKSLM